MCHASNHHVGEPPFPHGAAPISAYGSRRNPALDALPFHCQRRLGHPARLLTGWEADRLRPLRRPGTPCEGDSALFVVAVDGGGVQRITPWGYSDNQGSWSPDGAKIAFEHLGSLFVVHPDGTGLAKIPLAISSRSRAGDFAWSLDGEKIVFLLFTRTGPQSFQEGIATANADGSGVQQVTNSPTCDHQADWGHHPTH